MTRDPVSDSPPGSQPGAGRGGGASGRLGAAGIALRVLFCALLVAVGIAIAVQDFGSALPLGLFNEGRAAYRWLSLACAGLVLGGLAVFALELWRGRPSRLAGALRGLLVFVVLLEAGITVVDVTLVSRGAARLGGPYRELRAPDGAWVTLKKPHAGSPLGFRGTRPHATGSRVPRVLFLGDSYTEGSGRAPACNYPEVAGAELARRLGRPVQAMNAGVAGAGPVDALRVLRLLVEDGYRIDAVVYSLFLENDFTDNLPGTDRRVVAGINYRFPESWFLRTFHPLNTRLFRTALFVQRASRFVRGGAGQVRREDGPCQLAPEPLGEVPPGLADLVRRRFRANYGPGARVAEDVVGTAVDAMRDTARRLGVPFVLVVFPDRILVDEALQRRLGLDPASARGDAGRLRRFVARRFEDVPRIDVAPALAAGSENYRSDDTHLSDLGNLRAGRAVGRRLAAILGAEGFDGAP